MADFDLEIARKLLSKAQEIAKENEVNLCKTGGGFNIFKIADIETKERIICRVMADLLNPKGQHGLGAAYLKLFLDACPAFDKQLENHEIENLYVSTERFTDEGRPIDIVIEGYGIFIPIEVKIYADDQSHQCYDYCTYARRHDKSAKIVYITRFGTPPSGNSKGELDDGDIVKLSFATDILSWLKKCLALPETNSKAPVREILAQFIATIQKFTNRSEDSFMTNMVEMLTKSKENMYNAKVISDSMEACRAKIIHNMYTSVEAALENEARLTGKRLTENLHDYGDFKSEEPVDAMKTCINYIVKSDDEIQEFIGIKAALILRIEIDSNLYAGFQFARNGKCGPLGDLKDNGKAASLFKKDIQFPQGSWYYIYDYVYIGDKSPQNRINFRSCNKNYFKLFDEATFKDAVNATVATVKRLLDALN